MAKSDWQEISGPEDMTDVFTPEGAEQTWKLYQEAKQAYRVYKVARDKFESEMQAGFELAEALPEGTELKFGYNFGKLSVAIGEARERKPKKGTKQSFGDWLKAQREGGHNT